MPNYFITPSGTPSHTVELTAEADGPFPEGATIQWLKNGAAISGKPAGLASVASNLFINSGEAGDASFDATDTGATIEFVVDGEYSAPVVLSNQLPTVSASAATDAFLKSDVKPLINWTYLDPDGDPQNAYVVKLGTTPNGSEIVEYSGTGTASSYQYAGADLPAGSQFFWSVAVTDGEFVGGVGPDKVYVGQIGSAYINNPPLVAGITIDGQAGGGVVTSSTPTISWLYSDSDNQTQKFYRVQVYSDIGLTTLLWDSLKRRGSRTSIVYGSTNGGLALPYHSTIYVQVTVFDTYTSTSAVESFVVSHAPKIIVVTVDNRINPTNIKSTRPIFTWDYTDADNDALVAYDIRVSTSDDLIGTDSFVGEIWHTGVVTTNEAYQTKLGITPSGDTAFPSCEMPHALIPGVKYYFQVQVYDAYDKSEWWTGYFVKNLPPSAVDLEVIPAQPFNNDDLEAVYTFSDTPGESESDRTEIRWYQNGVRVRALDNKVSVPSSYTIPDDEWHFTVRPHDGQDFGQVATSAAVTIVNRPPQATNLFISPQKPRTADNLEASFSVSDPDGDDIVGKIRWYRNDEEVTSLRNSRVVPAALTTIDDEWYFTVTPNDGYDDGATARSVVVTVANTAPKVTSVKVAGEIMPRQAKDQNPIISWTYHDDDEQPQKAYRVVIGTKPFRTHLTAGRDTFVCAEPSGGVITMSDPDADITSGNEVFDSGILEGAAPSLKYVTDEFAPAVSAGAVDFSSLLNYSVKADLKTIALLPGHSSGDATMSFPGLPAVYETRITFPRNRSKRSSYKLVVDGVVVDQFVSTTGVTEDSFTFKAAKINSASVITIRGAAVDTNANASFTTLEFVPLNQFEMTASSFKTLSGYLKNEDGSIRLAGLAGTASTAFPLPTGVYDIELVYTTESTGNPSMSMSVNNSVVLSFVFESGVGSRSKFARAVSISAGDIVKISGSMNAGASARVAKVVFKPVQAATNGAKLLPGRTYYATVKVFDGEAWSQWATTKFSMAGSSWASEVSNSIGWTIEARLKLVPVPSTSTTSTSEAAPAADAAVVEDAATTTPVVTAAVECESDSFQGIRFYDGTRFGYLRVHPTKVELLAGSAMEFALDGAALHTYRVTARGADVLVYVDGELAIDGTGKFTQPSSSRTLEFGDIAGRKQTHNSEWASFKYSVEGVIPPNQPGDYVLQELVRFPGSSIGRTKAYKNFMYASVDPADPDESSSIFRYEEGVAAEHRSVLAITQSSITAVVVDPNRSGNSFGTSGKFVGTDRGLQYVLGGKPFPFMVTTMDSLPDEVGWSLDENCLATCASVSGDILTIDTTSETGERYHKYVQGSAADEWVENASNKAGWTVEVRVRVDDDGNGNAVTAGYANGRGDDDNCPRPVGAPAEETDIEALGVLVNDGTYEETIQFFRTGIRLKSARVFGSADLSVFSTVRIIGKGSAIAVYAKADGDKFFKRVINAPDSFSSPAQSKGDQESPSVAVDSFGFRHVVWQDSKDGRFTIQHSRATGTIVSQGNNLTSPLNLPADNMIPARVGFGLPPAGDFDPKTLDQRALISGSASFVTAGVKKGDTLFVRGAGVTRKYSIESVPNEVIVLVDTSDDLSEVFLNAEYVIVSGEQTWGASRLVSSENAESTNPRMISHSNGDIYVTYQNNSGGNSDIYCRHGKTSAKGVAWLKTVRVTNSSANSVLPDISELPSGDIIVVWQSNSLGKTRVLYSTIDIDTFGSVAASAAAEVSSADTARRPRVASDSGSSVVVVFEEDDEDGVSRVMAAHGDTSAGPVQFSSTTRNLTVGAGPATKPAVAAEENFFVTWEEMNGEKPAVMLSTLVDVESETWVSEQYSDSRGSCRNPAIAINKLGLPVVAYDDDRLRDGFPELYVATESRVELPPGLSFDPETNLLSGVPSVAGTYDIGFSAVNSAGTGTGTFTLTVFDDSSIEVEAGEEPVVVVTDVPVFSSALTGEAIVGTSFEYEVTFDAPEDDPVTSVSSGRYRHTSSGPSGTGVDVKLETYLTTSSRPSVASGTDGELFLAWEGQDAFGSRIYGAPYDGFSTDTNRDIVAYFPMSSYASDGVRMFNKILSFGSGGLMKEPTFMTGLGDDVALLADVAAGHSLFSEESDTKGVDIADEGNGFSLPTSSFLNESGAIDMWLTPHWSTDDATVQQYVFFGNGSLSTTTADTISFGVDAGASTKSLILRIVDSEGRTHETRVVNDPLNLSDPVRFSWAAEESVHVRAVWNSNAVGVSSLNSTTFPSASVGYACGGNGSIFKTTNGGTTWSELTSGVTYDLFSVDFFSTTVGAACGEGGAVLKTTDGGVTWQSMDTGVTVDLRGIFVRTASIWYAAGAGSTIIVTTDAGATWTQASIDEDVDFTDISVAYNASPRVVAVGGSSIYRSTDDGSTFSLLTSLPSAATGQSFKALSKDHSGAPFSTYAVGTSGLVLSDSGTGGATWTDVSTGLSSTIWGVAHDPGAGSDNVCVVGSSGFLASSDDGGDTWGVKQTGVSSSVFKAVASKDNQDFVAVGTGGMVMLTDDAGSMQYYAVARCGALTIRVNGKEPVQTRTGDLPFVWDPTAQDNVFLGDYREDGTNPASAIIDEVVIYRRPPPSDATYAPRQMAIKQPVSFPIQSTSAEKRIEWGSISPLVKTSSQWKAFKVFACGAREPLYVFSWNAQLGLVDDVVRDLAYDETTNRLWVATENGVSNVDVGEVNSDIDRFLAGQQSKSNSSARFVNYTNLANGLLQDSINTIAVDPDGNVWAGANKGIMFLKKDQPSADSENSQTSPKFASLPSEGRVLVIRIIGQNAFVGTDRGLAVFPLDAFTSGTAITPDEFTTADGLPSNRVQAIVQDKDGAIWIGTDRGATRFAGDHSIGFDAASGLPNTNVYSIVVDDENRKYLGTGAGIVVIEDNETTVYPPATGIGVGAIRAGAADSAGHLWFATATGLSELNFDCGSALFTKYDVSDGIVGDPLIENFKRYWILGGDIPSGGCNKALVRVSVNGEELAGGYDVAASAPFLVFDEARTPSDEIEVCLEKGWRKVHDFGLDSKNSESRAAVTTGLTRFSVYRKRFAAGTVVLGGNLSKGAPAGSVAMYFVAVEEPDVATVSSPVDAVVGTAEEGESPYVDVDDEVSLFPNFMRGLDMVKLPSADADSQAEEYLEMELSEDSNVYVAYDSTAASLPNWLRSFKRIQSTQRVTDMETFVDATNDEKLFASTSGTNGCVYEVLNDPTICDISAGVALDGQPPVACATISRINSLTDVTLALTASDAISGVADMQVSARADFTTDGTTAVEFVPFQSTYQLTFPASSATVEELVAEIPEGEATCMVEFDGDVLIGTSNPGHVYRLTRATGDIELEFDTGEDSVDTMAVYSNYLAVGTSPNGKAFVWNGETLQQLSLSLGEEVSAMAAFDNRLFLGTSPAGKIYEVDTLLNVALFMDTYETAVTSFAVFGGRLFWSTMNDFVEQGDVVSATTTKGHKHTFVIPEGAERLGEASGTTSTADGHSHEVVDGVVQEANGHTHALNASTSGKVFRHDISIGQTKAVHSDKDYWITSLGSTSLGADGVMFAGTYPNGKILRYVPQDSTFVKSFDTLADRISRLKVINQKVYAMADNDIFFFDGNRWQFVGAADAEVVDIIGSGNDLLVLKSGEITVTSGLAATSAAALAQRTLCAYVKFRDVAGNVTQLRDAQGNLVECFSPCATFVPPGGGTDGGGGTLPQVHRIVELDEDANVVFTLNGAEVFYSGSRVEKEIGVYESEVFNGTTSLVQWVSLTWEGVTPSGTSITIAVRSADSAAGIADAEWGDEFTDANENDLTNLSKQFLQFRATLIVEEAGQPSPELHRVDIQLRTSQATHYFTTNFTLPDDLLRGILTYNGCVNPPVTDVVFGISGMDSTDFADYLVVTPNKVFELPSEHQTKNLRVGIKFISSPQEVPFVDEFALLVSLANDAVVKFNLTGTPSSTSDSISGSGSTRTVLTDQVQGHTHTVTFDAQITDKSAVNGQTSINSGHSHVIVNGEVQQAAGHSHSFEV